MTFNEIIKESNKQVTFTSAIPFNRPVSLMSKIVDGAITFTPSTSGSVAGCGCMVTLIANGVNAPSFDASFKRMSTSDNFTNTEGRVHQITFWYDGTYYYYTISQTHTVTIPDVTAPTVSSATTGSANTIVIVFSEIVTATNIGWSFKQNGSTITTDSISGSGTNTITFTFSETLLGTDTLLRTYDSSTGDTMDASSNELASFTDQPVTNNLVSEEFIVWSQLLNMTNAGSGTLDNSNSSTGGGTATKKLPKSNGNYVQYVIPATPSETNTFVLSMDDNNDANYNWGGGSAVVELAGIYLNTTIFAHTGSSGGGTNTDTTVAPSAGEIWRMEISGDNVIVKRSTNSGSSFSTVHTFSNVLTGVTDIFIKGILAVGSGSQRVIQNAKGFGLTTI